MKLWCLLMLLAVCPARAAAQSDGAVTVTLTAVWEWPTNMAGVVGFRLYHGTRSGTYFESFATGLVTNYSMTITRLVGQIDYFVVTAVDDSGLESLPSNEAEWPPPPYATLSWNAPSGVVEVSPDLKTWTVLMNVTGSSLRVSLTDSAQFFRVLSDRQTTLTIRFDPL